MNYPERFEIFPAVDTKEAALTWRTIGWTLLVHDAMFLALFAPAALRDGSLLFPIWMVVQGLAGIVLAVEGARKEDRMTVVEGREASGGIPGREEQPRNAA